MIFYAAMLAILFAMWSPSEKQVQKSDTDTLQSE